MEQHNYNGDREIDLRQLIMMLWRNVSMIALAGIITGALLMGVKTFTTLSSVNDNGYIGNAKIYVASDVPSTTAAAIRTYFTSNSLLNSAIEELNLNLTAKEVESMINLNNSSSTLIVINVIGDDENLVQDVTDYLTVHGLEQVKSGFKYKSALIIEPAFTDVNTGIGWVEFIKGVVKYGLIGFLLGLGVVAAIYAFLFIHDSSIKDESDVNNYLGIPVLGVIPAIDGTRKIIDKNKKNRKLRLS